MMISLLVKWPIDADLNRIANVLIKEDFVSI